MSDKNLPASPRKVAKAKREGQVARAPELTSEAVLLWGLFMLSLLLGSTVLTHWFSASLRASLAAATETTPGPAALRAVTVGLGPGLALLALMWGGAAIIALVVGQTVAGGVNVSWEALEPKFERLNPATGLQRMASAGAVGSTLLGLLKLVLGLGALALLLPKAALGILSSATTSPDALLSLVMGRFMSVGFSLAGILVGIAVIQALWSRKRWMDELKMSKHEAVEDAKESEGDPRMKRRFRLFHRKLARQRTIQAVAASDVILANPTHVAVALRYKRGRMRAPRVMAKGAELMALRIKEEARKLGIPVVEQPALARDLYASVPVGREVPVRLYRAVARVIHQIQRLSSTPSGSRAQAA